jgi:hypothetical protein
MKNLSRPGVLAVFVLTAVVSMAGQENKNRRGDGTSPPPDAAKSAAPSNTEARPNDEQANSSSHSNKQEARRARLERHKRLKP